MTLAEMIALADLFGRLAACEGAAFSETVDICRVDQVRNINEANYGALRNFAWGLERSGSGSLELFAAISGKIDLRTQNADQISGEDLSLRLTKSSDAGTSYFLTLDGFVSALKDQNFVSRVGRVWIAREFAPFTTQKCAFMPWGFDMAAQTSDAIFDSPRRLVRDQSHNLVPSSIAPWYFVSGGEDDSDVFNSWKALAARNLSFCLPSELRVVDDGLQAVLKGTRSAFASVDEGLGEVLPGHFDVLMDGVRWVYDQRRDTETKFHLLNNHLALYWTDGAKWPAGLVKVLENALNSAREAFAFHLQDDSKEAIKSLGDLRKALQDEVARSQSVTRDLLSALWRDAAVAGAVFALRTATSTMTALNVVAAGAAMLLFASILTSILSNWRFDILAKQGREQWRKRLYTFMSEAQWKELVTHPLERARWVYRLSILPVGLVYVVLIGALLWVAFPESAASFLAGLPQLFEDTIESVKLFWAGIVRGVASSSDALASRT